MQVNTIAQFLFLALTAGVSAYAFVRLRSRVRLKYESRYSLIALLLSAFFIFLLSTLMFFLFGIVFTENPIVNVYVVGSLLILCSTIILLSTNVLVKDREHFRQLEEIQRHHDSVTGLPKHGSFVDHVEKSLAKSNGVSPYHPVVLVILISGLRQLDRRVGFGFSDFVIRTVAQRMHAALRTTDYVARLGENIFAVYIEDLQDRGNVYTVSENIIEQIKKPIQVDTEQMPIFPFIGIAFYNDNFQQPNEIIKYAQAAALDACDRGMEVIVADNIIHADKKDNELLNVLQRGLKDRSFKLYYQPQVKIDNLKVIGAEALIRLPSEDWMSIGGGELVELAERNGMIHQLDMLVFEMLFEQIKKWVDKNIEIRVAVNMSIKSFKNHSLLDYLIETLEDNPEWGRRLKIEITETASLDNIKELTSFMKQIAPKGVLFSIDDFGTRYSSMEYMQRLPVHEVKIDKSFILSALNDLTSEKIVRSVIQLAHGLELSVTAEGVESEEMLKLLQSWHCDQAQGFYFAQAMSADKFEEYFAESQARWH